MNVYDWRQIEPEHVTQTSQRKIALGENIGVAHLEDSKGSIKYSHRHPHEVILVLLKGKWRFRFSTGDVVLTPDQVLTIPAETTYSSEALEDVVAIEVSASPQAECLNDGEHALHHDPDQYLWGV